MTDPAIALSVFFIFILILAITYVIVFLTLYGAFAVFIAAANRKLPAEERKEVIKAEIKLIVTPVAYTALFVTGVYAFWTIIYGGGLSLFNSRKEERWDKSVKMSAGKKYFPSDTKLQEYYAGWKKGPPGMVQKPLFQWLKAIECKNKLLRGDITAEYYKSLGSVCEKYWTEDEHFHYVTHMYQ